MCMPTFLSGPSFRFLQVTRSNTTAHGRLVIKLSEDPTRWLVTYDEGSFHDEEVAEESLGPIVGKFEDQDPSQKPADSSKSAKSKKKARNKNGIKSDKGSRSSNSSSDETTDSKRKRKSVSFSQEGKANDTDGSSAKDTSDKKRPLRSKVSDREERSRRRQAMIEVEKQATTKRPSNNTSIGPSKKVKAGSDEEVIKVQMLTGTLYLYRGGLRRRVEFIRKY